MKRLWVKSLAPLVLTCLLVSACSQAAPTASAPSATAPAKQAEPTKVAEPSKPTLATPSTPAAQAPATTAVASKSDYPQKGKAVSVIVPHAAGTGNDLAGRLISMHLEKDLGVPFQVVNKPGAATQIGMTDLAKAKPDGYTLASTSTVTTVLTYMDSERQAVFGRKDLLPVAVFGVEPMVLVVKSDSPYKTTKDLVDAAKANPEKIKVGDNGLMSPTHMITEMLAIEAGVKFAPVHFNGDPESQSSLLGGHTDASASSLTGTLSNVKTGSVRVLGISETDESRFLPGVKTLPAQGYKVVLNLSRGLNAPTGTPKDVVDALSQATKRITETQEFKTKAEQTGLDVAYWDPQKFASHYDELDKTVKTILDAVKNQRTK